MAIMHKDLNESSGFFLTNLTKQAMIDLSYLLSLIKMVQIETISYSQRKHGYIAAVLKEIKLGKYY